MLDQHETFDDIQNEVSYFKGIFYSGKIDRNSIIPENLNPKKLPFESLLEQQIASPHKDMALLHVMIPYLDRTEQKKLNISPRYYAKYTENKHETVSDSISTVLRYSSPKDIGRTGIIPANKDENAKNYTKHCIKIFSLCNILPIGILIAALTHHDNFLFASSAVLFAGSNIFGYTVPLEEFKKRKENIDSIIDALKIIRNEYKYYNFVEIDEKQGLPSSDLKIKQN